MIVKDQNIPASGILVVFLIGKTDKNLETTEIVESKAMRRSPNYPDVIPKQKIIKVSSYVVDGNKADLLVKAYLPDIVIAEVSVPMTDLLSEYVLDFKKLLFNECRTILSTYGCNPDFDEEYTVYCISGYSGDPEEFLAMHGETMAILLKNERAPLDEEEVESTLKSSLKYSKDDLSIVDWDGAFLFDPKGDFSGNIELFEIANLKLLKLRILNEDLDKRLKKAADLLRRKPEKIIFRSKEIRERLREIIKIRTESILESEAIEANIKLIGDWYSAKLYNLISKKFHLDSWKHNIDEKLDVLEDVYSMASENLSISLSTTLEFVLIGGWFILLLGWFALFFLDLYLRNSVK